MKWPRPFAGTLVDRYAGALITYMIDIGLRTRLFEAAAPGPATSTELAERADGPHAHGPSTLHCLTVSLAYGGTGLGAVWGEQLARQMLADAGFTDVSVAEVPGDPLNSLYVAR